MMPAMTSTHSVHRPLRLAVLISGAGSTLANLIDRIADGRLRGVEIRLVISSRRLVGGVAIAEEAGLPVEVIRRRDFSDEPAFSDALTAAIDRADVDLVTLGGFLRLWQLPARYEGRVLNIHPALLPKHGGRGMHGGHVHAAVLAAGDLESGCTVHLIDNEYDHGPIIARRRVPVRPDDTPETLAQRVGVAERELYPDVIQNVVDHGLEWLHARAQPQSVERSPS